MSENIPIESPNNLCDCSGIFYGFVAEVADFIFSS